LINGKAVLKFGAVCFNKAEPGEINRKTPVVDPAFSKEASVVMTFLKTESIDVVVEALIWLKNTMNDTTPKTDQIDWDKPFDLDIL